jgi:[acyl-carrier-protein] S-malonyltransferase
MIAYVFPGQGSQAAGMGRDLAQNFPAARSVFEEADAALGFALSKLCFEGPDSELQLTENTQPAILTTSIAALRAMESEGFPKPDYVAGHSLGEYSALVAAGALTFTAAVRAVRLRGQYMQEAVPVGEGAMAAILGADLRTIEDACEEAHGGGVCSPANINAPGQVVIAGTAGAVDRAIEILKTRGAKRAIKLNVSAPFHCALMIRAQERLAADLEQIEFANLGVSLVSNVDAALTRSGVEARAKLIAQVSRTVRWQESVERLAGECGVGTFVEVGTGKVLSGLIRKTAAGARCLNVEDGASLRATRTALGEDPKASERAAGGE